MGKRTFFRWEDGDMRWTPFAIWFGILTLIGFVFLGPEIKYAFFHRFGRAGIWMLLGVAAAGYIWYQIDKYYDKHQDAAGLNPLMGLVILLVWGPIFITAGTLREDRKAAIPDVSVYHMNGKIKNVSNPSKKDFYFNTFDVSSADSLYILQYGEEPGYNTNWRSVIQIGNADSSYAPRANEDWKKPLPNSTIKR